MLCDWDGNYQDLLKVLEGKKMDKPVKSGKWRDGYYSNEPYNLQETDIADEDDKSEEIRESDEQQEISRALASTDKNLERLTEE